MKEGNGSFVSGCPFRPGGVLSNMEGWGGVGGGSLECILGYTRPKSRIEENLFRFSQRYFATSLLFLAPSPALLGGEVKQPKSLSVML